MTTKIKFFSTIRKRKTRNKHYVYTITIPKAVAEAYELEKYLGKKVKVVMIIE